MKRTVFYLPLVLVIVSVASGCYRQLRVEPQHATVRLDQSIALSAAHPAKQNVSKTAGGVTWKARNVTAHQPAIISPDGTFTASLPGKYKITAISGRLKGHAIARVPEGATRDPNEQPWTTTTVSTRGVNGAVPPLPQPPLTGPGWRDDNLLSAFLIQNRRGRDPLRPRSKTRSLNVDGGTGNGNYLLEIPVLDLSGRGLNLSLSLFYNSQLWVGETTPMVFDHDHGWPAAGWSLCFGRVLQYGSDVGVLEDADGTLHPFSGPVGSYGDFTQANIQTNDGTLIDGTFFYENSRYYGGLSGGWIKYPISFWTPDSTAR